MASRPPQIAVVGAAGGADGPTHGGPTRVEDLAERVGAALGEAGAVLLTGGRGGVMAAASRGARQAGGRTVGVLPGIGATDSPPNDDVETAIFTGMGQARNLVLVLSARAVIAVGGGWGTLSEIAMALKHRIPVVTLASWDLERPDGAAEPLLTSAATPEEAVRVALEAASG